MPTTTTQPRPVDIADVEACYRAVAGRDRRFDGRLFLGVTSTGIYCRPSCPARTPKPENVRFYATAAAAVAAGFRACRRCRPEALPGSRDWDHRADLAARALRLIGSGAVDEAGVSGLANRLAVSERHLHRVLVAELGCGPLALARTRRAQTARLLLDQTDLPVTEIAYAAGFASIRQFNEVLRAEFGLPPTALRRRMRQADSDGRAPEPGAELVLRLVHREPYDSASMLLWYASHGIPRVEHSAGTTYRRVVRTRHGAGVVRVEPGAGHVTARLRLADLADLAPTVAALRRALDLDADPFAVDAVLGADPHLGPLVAARPGLRAPGAVDGFELAVRAVLAQQVSVAAATRLTEAVVLAHGAVLPASLRAGDDDPLTHAFPAPEQLAEAPLTELRAPESRRRAIRALASAVADGRVTLDPGSDRDETRASLLALPGIGPWTAGVVAMEALADPDAWLPGDVVLERHVRAMGADPEAWRPWRSYAAMHLWTAHRLSGPPTNGSPR